MPEQSYRAKELFLYWQACQQVRQGGDALDGYDEVYCIGLHTEWPALATRCAQMLDTPHRAVQA